MTRVFDSSSLLVISRGEPGAEIALGLLPDAVMSTVNYAEVMTKLTDRGMTERAALDALEFAPVALVPLLETHAVAAGRLVALTKPFGLSLGDRCCLALALEREATVVTADRVWAELAGPLSLEIVVTRPA